MALMTTPSTKLSTAPEHAGDTLRSDFITFHLVLVTNVENLEHADSRRAW
jgi:hypothetical protein